MKEKNRKNWRISVLLAGMAIALTWVWAPGLQALKYPHNPGYVSNPVSCDKCHSSAAAFKSLTSLDVMCINASGCHNTSGKAGKKRLTTKSASNRFLSLPVDPTAKQSSHGWDIPNTNPDAGATNNWYPAREYMGWTPLKGRISCTRCHRAHGDMMNVPIYRSFLKGDPKGDDICFQCHAARRVNNVRDALPSSSMHYSHPVEVNYSSARAKPGKSSLYFKNPTSSYPANPSATLKLYTTKAGVKGAVVCSTCHGPIHSADSNPKTFDNLTTYASGNYSTSAGNLLRRYDKAKDLTNDLCKSCHKVTTHQTLNCYRCHTPHKKANESNRYLILQNISTPNSGNRPVQFISTSEMADRWTDQGVGGTSNAICQVCHTTTKWHRNYSTVGPTGLNREGHASPNEYLGSLKYRACIACHTHGSGFSPAGAEACGSCHNAQLSDTNGKHVKHVGTASYTWSDGALGDARSASSYGFSCGRCHSRWDKYTGDIRHKSPYSFDGYSGDAKLKVYTADIGFKRKGILPNNTAGSYTYGATAGYDDGANAGGSKWRYPNTGASDGLCKNVYCHGQFYNGYTSNDPTWRNVSNAQTCGKCHGATAGDPPGRTGSNKWGAHDRHIGSANNQQYGFAASPTFRCNACHYTTSIFNKITALDSKLNHVDGRVNILFNYTVGNAASRYGTDISGNGGFNSYSSRKPAMFTKPAYASCKLTYCHSDGSRLLGNYSVSTHTLAFKYPNWSSTRNFTTTQSGTKRRCARCHGSSYTGLTSSMPGYVTRAGKGNSHAIHVITNGFMCRVCHSQTVNTDNKSIADTTKHVNKVYNVNFLSAYDGGGASYDSATHKCTNIKCHGNKTTPAWGTTGIICQDCHLSNASDTDKRILPGQKFQSFSGTAAKIYSTQWANVGHGRTGGAGNPYPNSGNSAAGKVCTDCHGAGEVRAVATKHGTGVNPFRLYTAPDRPNVVCNKCHGVGGVGASKIGILTHASSVTATGRHNYEIKCIDCHDPHGDNNIFMVHSTVRRPTGSGRDLSSGKYGIITSNAVVMNVDFVNNVYTSDYAKKSSAPRICQACHDETYKPSSSLGFRYRYNGSTDTTHGSGKCIDCHQHTSGFKGAGCNACHGNPPDGTKSILGGPSTTTSKPASGAGSAGAHAKHITVYGSGTTTCAKCHQGGMYDTGSEDTDIEIGFSAFGVYTGVNQKYTGKSAVRTGNYGYAGGGITTGDTMRCNSMKCHGGGTSQWLTKNFGTPTAPEWYTPSTGKCGMCHGAKKAAGSGSWPTSNAHARHVGTGGNPNMQYDFMCKLCHNTTVLGTNTTLDNSVHVNAQANFLFYTGNGLDSKGRVWSGSAYNGGDTAVNTGFGRCENTYCHSRGTDTVAPYDGAALPNYTAKWNESPSNKCNYCHGNKTWNGITAAMPNQGAGNSHLKHVISEKFKCYVCHANVVDASGKITSRANHVNKFKNISIITTYKTANENYVDGTDKCSNVKCHGGRTTPAWGSSAACTDCHYRATAASDDDTDSFTFQSYSGASSNVAKIYSTQWMNRGHGKTKVSGKYPFSNNTGAGKTCGICHTTVTTHNTGANYFRIRTTVTLGDSDKLCLACHGSGASELGKMGAGTFGRITGIKSHTYYNMSTYGEYKGGTNGKAGWNNPLPKCVDCHDPHGDNNNAMLHKFINMSGSDAVGAPSPVGATAQVRYTAVGGQVAWSSFVRSDFTGICQRCHSSEVDFFDKAQFGNPAGSHNNASGACKNCHKHKKGFAPTGCTSCHGDDTKPYDRAKWSPPKGPSGWSDSLSNKSSIHLPHSYNPNKRPGFGNQTGFACQYCHDDSVPAASGHNSGKTSANLNNLTSTSGYNGYNSQSKLNLGSGTKNPANDTCWNTRCHTPRSYTRTWQKPKDCDDCHGTIRLRGATERAYNLHTTNSHKIHINYTGVANPPTAWGKNYRFACSNCHYNVGTNYSTHYSGQVNITSNGPINTVGGQFYARGRSFKGFTTGGEVTNTSYCTKVYCHGNFTNGTTTTRPSWKKGATALSCGSCHKAKTAKVSAAWSVGTTMPVRHPKHVRTATYNFSCSKCHVRTVTNNTTVYFQYSAHVNGQVNVVFDSVSGTYTSGNKTCKSNYCHSSGQTPAAPYPQSNWTANWTKTATQITGSGKECSLCHGNKTYAGITAAMPNQGASNSHLKHVVTEKFKCYVCHANVVNSNGGIVSYGNHVNKFKNISIILTYKSGATNYVDGTDRCSNVKCHGGRTTPAWGTTSQCADCHYVASGTPTTEDNFSWQNYSAPTANVAKIYSSEWMKFGHGRSGSNYLSSNNPPANKTCTNCHKASASHNTGSNPFRLHTSDSNKVCASCHGSTSSELGKWGNTPYASKTSIDTHSKTATGGNAEWNFGSHLGADQNKVKCVDCHDPHGDRNRSMIHSLINYTGSSNYGTPSPVGAAGQMIYSTVGGQIRWSSFVRPTASPDGLGLCQRCHTPTANMLNFNKSDYSGHNSGTKCTQCHSHKSGFKGGGESIGDLSCKDCHSSLFDPMNSQASSYHHVMQNSSAYAGTGDYPTANNISSIDPRRRCLMCHVDHNIFNPAVNASGDRAGNLRRKITETPGATTWAKSDFIKDSTMEGICISCHKIAQTKNKTKQFSDSSSKTLRITYAQYSSSPHSYVVPSSQYLDSNGSGDTSRFDANCVKCHNDTMTKTKFKASTSFGLHDSQLRRINSKLGLKMDSGTATAGAASTLTDSTKSWVVNEWGGQPVTITSGTGVGQTRVVASNTATVLTMTKTWTTNPNATSTYTIGDPVEENYCYNCHGVSQNPNFAIGKDYYGVATYVNTKALKMEQTFNGVAGSVTAAAIGPPTTITDSTKSWSSNQWAGYIIKITSGKRAGSEGEILSNTATQVTLVTPWSKVPAAADQYSIGNPFRHRIDNFGGQHKSDEGLSAPAGLTTFGWFTAVGTKLHVGCADCHNPHAQRKPASDRGTSSTTLSTISTVVDTTKSWTANQWVGFKLVPASRSQIGSERVIISNTATKLKVDAVFSTKLTGVYYYINPLGRAKVATAAPATQKGNMLNGPNNGQWGATPTAWPTPTPSATPDVDAVLGPTTFSKVTTLTSGTNYIYELCFKCHSQYGWGTSGTPFNTMGGNNGSEGPSTHIAAEFNPNNLAHHALVDIGMNQPITATGQTVGTASYYNTNWPKYNAATIGITTAGVATFSTNVFNIVKSAIPGWYLFAGSNAPGQGLTQNWYQITEITGANTAKVTPAPGTAVGAGTASFLTAGLGNNFVPPYGPWSVISCADCHDTDGASDPKGPHGSGQKWLLKGLRKQTFTWWNGTANQTTSYGPSSADFVSDNGKMICLNCHRADVYGFNQQTPSSGTAPAAGDDISNFIWKATWAREKHTPDASAGRSGMETYNIFGIYCMNCHLGGAMGQVHGTNMGKSLDTSRSVITTGASYRGKRFLTGGAWTGVVRGDATTSVTSQCYVQAGATAVNSCTDNAVGDFPVGKSNYDYQTGTDY